MKTVFLFISNYVHSSDLLRTDYIVYLASKYKVVVFLPETFDISVYPKLNNVYFYNLPIIRKKFWYYFKEFRITLNRNHNNWADIIFNKARVNILYRRHMRMLAKIFPKFIFTNNTFTLLETIFSKKESIFAKLIEKHNPILFLTPTPGLKPFEAQAIIQAKKFKIPTVAINFSWDNLTSNFRHTRKTDYLIAWNGLGFNQAVKLHNYSKDRIFVSGPVRFDYYFRNYEKEMNREDFLKSKNLNPEKKTLLLTSVTKSYPFQKEIIRRLIKLRNSGDILGNPNIFIRIHPLDLIENYAEFKGINDIYIESAGKKVLNKNDKENIEMTKEDLINLKHTIKYCDVNINYASTITIEAFVFNKPVVNFSFNDVYGMAYEFKHYEPISKSGSVKIIKTDQELTKSINQYLSAPEEGKEKRRAIAEEYIPYQDGLACRRNVDFLEKIIKDIK